MAECRRNGILPGLWFSTNTLVKINAAPQWQDSLNKNKGSMWFYEGGFLPDFMTVLQDWCERGDSNPHGLPRQILSLVRLPIPPLSHV
jgi:hypothetical protein